MFAVPLDRPTHVSASHLAAYKSIFNQTHTGIEKQTEQKINHLVCFYFFFSLAAEKKNTFSLRCLLRNRFDNVLKDSLVVHFLELF